MAEEEGSDGDRGGKCRGLKKKQEGVEVAGGGVEKKTFRDSKCAL